MDVQGKGLWSEVVRRKEASTSLKSVEDGMRDLLISSGAVSEAACTSQLSPEAMTASALNADANAKPSGDGERGTSAEIVAEDLIPDGAANLSPTSVKSAWKNSSKTSNDSCDEAVMGSEFWPSLADSLIMKSAKSFQSDRSYNSTNDDKSEKELCTATVSDDKKNIDIDNRLGIVHPQHMKTELNKELGDAASSINTTALLPNPLPPIVVSDMVEHIPLQEIMPEDSPGRSASGNMIERGRSFNQRGNSNMLDGALTPRRNRIGGIYSKGGMSHGQWSEHGYVSGGMQNRGGSNRFYPQYERAPRQRGNGGPSHPNFRNRNIFQNQGRGNNNWQPQQFYADGPNHAQHFQQPNFDPINIMWNVPTFFPPNFGYINSPVHGGIYYPLIRSPGFSQGAGYYAPFEAPLVPPPASRDNSPHSLLAKQIEYYFSNENLAKDAFLRSRMDAEGFVSASLISSFNMIRKQNADTKMILEALQNSAIVEVQGDKLRSRHYWQSWLPTYFKSSSILGSSSSSTESSYNH